MKEGSFWLFHGCRQNHYSMSSRESIKVGVRLRPFNKSELKMEYDKVVDVDTDNATIYIEEPDSNRRRQFSYDYAFDMDSTQDQVFDVVTPILDGVYEGYNGTIFAYGQTGTGKTFTMDGGEDENRGIIPRVFDHLFDHIGNDTSKKYFVWMSYVEIYNEDVFDLLRTTGQKEALKVRESKEKTFYVEKARRVPINSLSDLYRYQLKGREKRVVRGTKMNGDSSRSHAILQLQIESLDQNEQIRQAKLNLVDLAGSESSEKTETQKEGTTEGININWGLMVLGRCIQDLTSKTSKIVPFRESNLTKLLKDSLGGNTRTLMIAAIGPASYNARETCNTLRYASEAKKIKNKPQVNMDAKDAMINKYLEEINKLKQQVDNHGIMSDEEIQLKEEELRNQRNRIKGQTNLVKEERERLENELNQQQMRLESEKKMQKEQMRRYNELREFTSKGSKLVEITKENEMKIRKMREELRAREEQEAELMVRVEETRQKKDQMNDQVATIESKVQVVNDKLSHYLNQYKSMKNQIPQLQLTIQTQKDEIGDKITEKARKIELCKYIIDNFIPLKEIERIKENSVFNKEKQKWEIVNNKVQMRKLVQLERPVSAIGMYMPTACEKISRVKKNLKNAYQIDIPEITLKPTPVEHKVVEGKNLIMPSAIEDAIDRAFDDDEQPDLIVELPESCPSIKTSQYNHVNVYERLNFI